MQYSGINIDCVFENKISLLSGYSGTGKTLLMKATELHCLNNGISCRYCDFRYREMSIEQIEKICAGVKVVLFDNADLYLNNKLLDKLKNSAEHIIICMKDTSDIDMFNITRYLVDYENLELTIEVL